MSVCIGCSVLSHNSCAVLSIEAFESEISEMETYLASPEGASDMDYLQKYLDVKNKLEKAMNKWERSTLELEKLQEN